MLNHPPKRRIFVFMFTLFFTRLLCCAEPLTLAVASNFNLAMQKLVAEYETNHSEQIQIAFASSGKIFAQIINGAPYDIFFSADQVKPKALIEQGFAMSESRITYAYGRLALWSAKQNFVDNSGAILLSNSYNKLALANPKLAPYGVAAIDTLTKLGILNATQNRWVQGENISQTYQFVATQNADIGFVALSQIKYQGKLTSGSAWIVPQDLYHAIKQDAVIIKNSKNKQQANDFMEFIQSAKAQQVMQDFGYYHGASQ
jgi:molybdate transport system substrate-binding protein